MSSRRKRPTKRSSAGHSTSSLTQASDPKTKSTSPKRCAFFCWLSSHAQLSVSSCHADTIWACTCACIPYISRFEHALAALHSPQEIQSEIAAIQRQITASVTFLPLNDEPCAFDLLVYTDSAVDVPKAWEESDPKLIVDSDEVKLRSFTTKVHKVDASVSYRAD